MDNSHRVHIFGWDILRILMCFEVVCIHFWKPGTSQGIYWIFFHLKNASVTSFFFISFYLNRTYFLSINKKKLRDRMGRLLIPFVAWAFLYYAVYWLADLAFDFPDKDYPLSQLILQLLTGHRLNQAMWFLLNMIIITFVFSLIFLFLPKDAAAFTVALFGLAAVCLQYSGITVRAFEELLGPRIGYDMNSFSGCVLIFFVSLAAVYLISLIPSGFVKKLVE